MGSCDNAMPVYEPKMVGKGHFLETYENLGVSNKFSPVSG